jgi:hypothetical protein
MRRHGATLYQGESYSEFTEQWDDAFGRLPPSSEAIRLINTQSEILLEELNQPLSSVFRRRQAIAYMLEQCILLCAVLPVDQIRDRRRMRLIRRMAERIRRLVRGDGL